jgi:hypothetical protein
MGDISIYWLRKFLDTDACKMKVSCKSTARKRFAWPMISIYLNPLGACVFTREAQPHENREDAVPET